MLACCYMRVLAARLCRCAPEGPSRCAARRACRAVALNAVAPQRGWRGLYVGGGAAQLRRWLVWSEERPGLEVNLESHSAARLPG